MDRLQPMDVSVNKPAKAFLRKKFQEWYTQEISKQLDGSAEVAPFDLRLCIVKPLGARWMMQLYDHMKPDPSLVANGFKGAGITDFLKL